ncbi:hypothetical protein [Actinomadura napierensis]|uniref:P/Homo B domain-containing protein n=1 Tax=Actinomadura napierensis TaxID=267854 RepID=A0ABP5MAF8_9ACTN
MAHDLKDLTEVMEAESARGVPSPDLLDGVRRRVRRGNRLRVAAAALGMVLVAGTSFGIVQQKDGPEAQNREVLAPAMSGVTNAAFPKSRSMEGLKPVKEVRFAEFGRIGRVTLIPTGPFTMYTARCERDATWYDVTHGMASTGCGGSSYMLTTPGVPITIETAVLPVAVASKLPDGSLPGAFNRFLAARAPVPGAWSLRVYSGPCASETCKMMRDSSFGSRAPQPPLTGLKVLGRATGTADGRGRRVPLKERGKALRLRVTCVDGAAHAVVRIAGRAKVVECEAAESTGVVWDAEAGDGTDAIDIAVLPAEVARVPGTGDAALAKLMKGVKPAGTWKLEVYAR